MQGEIDGLHWWQTRWFVLAAILASGLPLLWPAFPPLLDMPGHIGLYRIMAEAGQAPLAQHYAVHHALIGNLGVEGLVLALHPLLDVEPATHLIVGLIPPLTVAAMLWLAREAHGRIPATAPFALPLAFALPLQLGFVNFALAAALALAGLALWIRLGRTARPLVRIAIFLPIAGVVWLCHSFGWAMLGLFIFGAEWAIRRERGETRWRAALWAGLGCLPMAWPQLLATIGGVGLAGDTGDWFDLTAKAQWIASLLRERWKFYDVACVILLALLLWTAVRSRRLSFAPVLGVPAVLGLAAFLLLPRLYAGGAYVDMRILPGAIVLALLAIRVGPGEEALSRRLSLFGTGFFALRIVTSIVALALFAREQQAELPALALLPSGSAVLSLVDEPSTASWDNPRLGHIAGIAIARRRVFTNEQWAIAGQQLIVPLHPRATPLDRDPSQLVRRPDAPYRQTDFDQAITGFDRGTFDYVWTVGFPAGRAHAPDLMPIWSNARSALYRVAHPQKARLSSATSRR
ncbi:MAG: hypothetical protein JWN66_2575 [Sphingomonas bacterium]|uniref:hypothetical protein n=1 Tax=Sphingomonas bacterium TaxID=1895847 RepID=UPI0026399EA0|nr:hypothetical protein [Sphingomonas bacterium]MDB5705459.1 hypothetical protein [Sphingomonas bacterium]